MKTLYGVFLCAGALANLGYAGQLNISLEPADWDYYSASAPSTLTKTAEGYLRVTCNQYRGHIYHRSTQTFNAQDAIVRYRWRVNCGGQYSSTQDGSYPFSMVAPNRMSTHHSWAGSIIINTNVWIYTEIQFHSDRTWTANYSYSGYGQGDLATRGGTMSDATWDLLTESYIYKLLGDGYANSYYYDIAEAYVIQADPEVIITSPASDPFYAALNSPVVFQAETTRGTPPYAYQWQSDIDGSLGETDSLEVSTLSLGSHLISVTSTDSQSKQVSSNIRVHVLELPQIEAVADHTTIDAAYSGPLPVLSTGADFVTWSLVEGPEGMTIDAGNGRVSWPVPIPSDWPYTVTIRAENPIGSDEASFLLIVLAVPQIGAIDNASVLDTDSYTGPAPTLLKGTEPVTFSLVQGPGGMTIEEASGIVSWPVPAPSFGPCTITIRASNEGGYDDESWQLVVLSAPLINPISAQSVNEATPWHHPVPTLMKGTSPITWSVLDGPAGMLIDANSGVLTWDNPNADSSPYTITIQAANSYGTDSRSFTLTVIRPPVIEPIDDVEVVEGVFYTSPAPTLVQGTLPVTWSLAASPAGMTINPASGVVSWPNVPAVEGPHTVTIRAANAAGSDTRTWHIAVRVVPQLGPVANAEIPEGDTYAGPAPVLVKGTQPISYELVAAPAGMTIDPGTGVVTWPDTTADGSPYSVTIRASNAWGTGTVTWQVKVVRPPVVSAIGDAQVTKGLLYTGPTPGLDEGTLPVEWSLVTSPAGMTVNPTSGVVSWPGSPVEGIHKITLRAANLAGFDDEIWQLHVIARPIIQPLTDAAVMEFTEFTGPAPVLVEGTPPITWSLVTAPEGTVIDEATGVVSWSSSAPSVTAYPVRIRATNAVGSDEAQFSLTVLSPPLIQTISDVTIAEGDSYMSAVPGLSKGTAPVTWSLVGAPDVMTIDPATGVVSWPDASADQSPYTVTTVAENAYGRHERTWRLSVIRAPKVVSVSDMVLVENEALTHQMELTQGTLPVTWTLPQAPTGMTIDNQGIVRWSVVPPLPGPHMVTARVSNLAGADEATWQITVRILPRIAPVNDASVVEGQPYSFGPILTKGTLPVIWSLKDGPAAMSVDSATGIVTWTDTTAEGNPHRVTVAAANEWGTDQKSFNLTVIRVPVLDDIADGTLAENATYLGRTPILLDGTYPVTWTLLEGPAGMTINAQGVVHWARASAQGAPHTVRIRAANAAGADEKAWQINVILPPHIEPITDRATFELSEFTFQPTLTQGVLPVTFSLLQAPAQMTIDPDTGRITWPNPIAGAQYAVILKASNAAGIDTTSFWLEVKPAYTVQVQTDVELDKAGTGVLITGHTVWLDQTPAAQVPAKIRLNVKGSNRTFNVTSNARGDFQYLFQPLATEAGVFRLFGEHPSQTDSQPQDQFTLVGIRLAQKRLSIPAAPAVPTTSQIDLINLTDAAIDGITSEVLGLPDGWSLDVSAPASLQANETGALDFTFTAENDSIYYGEVDVVVRTAVGASTTVRLGITVVTQVPSLKVSPTTLDTTVVRGRQTLVKLTLFNEGAMPTTDLRVSLPNLPWLRLGVSGNIPALDPGENTELWLSLTPPDNLPLGPYTGTMVIAGLYTGANVDFNFHVVSEAKGDLLVRAEDEFTYYADGAPRVEGAQVVVSDIFSGVTVATGVTDQAGELLLTDLPESDYKVTVRADKHRDYTANIAVIPGRAKILTAFLPRQLVTYTWKVEPTEIEDHYEFILESTFETNVPVPVVTIEPANFDLDRVGDGSMQVDYTITNHGLIAAEDAWFEFGDNSLYTFTPIIEEIGSVPAQSSIVVPVLIERRSAKTPQDVPSKSLDAKTASADINSNIKSFTSKSSDQCREVTTAGVYYTLICGSDNRLKFVPVRFEYKRSCPETKPNKPRRTAPLPEEEDDGIDWKKLAEVLFPDKPSSGGSGGIGDAARQIYDRIVNYFVSSNPDIEVPPSSELGVPCDQCSFNVGKAVVGAIWDNVGALNKIKCAAGLGYNAGEIIRRCSYLGVTDWECLSGAYASIREIMDGCGGPDEDQWKQSIRDIAAAGLEHCVGISLSKSKSGSYDSSDLDALLLQFIALNERLDAFDASVVALLGDSAWIEADYGDSEIIDQWLAQFGLATTADSQDGHRICNTEWEILTDPMVVPQPASLGVEQLDKMILRWNRTIDYMAQGIYNSADLPPGFDDDFIALDVLDEKFAAAAAAAQATIDEGYDDLASAVLDAVDGLKEIVNDQEEGICAKVKIQIRQEAVITRTAFEATLEINNASGAQMDALDVDISISDELGNDANDLFVIMPPFLTGVSDVEGGGIIAAGATGKAEWIIVPTRDAAPAKETTYYVGGRFSYTLEGQHVEMPLFPDDILVRPDASLNVRYFHQKDVYSDDPFTEEIEPAEPFSLGLMMSNTGYGTAYRVCMSSSQPQILENEKGLLVDFEVINSQVGAEPVSPSLTVYLGDIDPGETVVARWLMQSSLQGQFTNYDASYVHLDGMGDPRLSLIDSLEIHEMVHAVKATYPSDDHIYDFLVNDIADGNALPDTLYLSTGEIAPVETVLNAQSDGAATPDNVQVEVTADALAGYNYIRLPDPSDGQMTLASVTRSDGVPLMMYDNAWSTNRIVRKENQPPRDEKLVHIFDHIAVAGEVSYTLLFSEIANPLVIRTVRLKYDPVSTIEVEFSRPIEPASFDWTDLALTLDDGPNLLYQPLAIRRLTDTIYRVSGLALLTAAPGQYHLTVDAAGIQDLDQQFGLGLAATGWTRTLTPWNIEVDGVVDNADFAALAANWLKQNCLAPDWCGGADITRNGRIGIEDLMAVGLHWLEQIE